VGRSGDKKRLLKFEKMGQDSSESLRGVTGERANREIKGGGEGRRMHGGGIKHDFFLGSDLEVLPMQGGGLCMSGMG